MKLRRLALLIPALILAGCMTKYPLVKPSPDSAYLALERNIASPPLGSITRYAKVDDQQQCHERYSDHPLLAVQNKGNPIVSDLNANGLYLNPTDDFRILINTVAGGASCDVIARFDVKAGQRYKILVSGDAWIGVNKCSARLFLESATATGQPAHVELALKEYRECNK